MAIITTKYAFGWYGSHENPCEDFNLSTELGTFSYANGKLNYIKGTADLKQSDASSFTFIALDSDNPRSWTLDTETMKFNRNGTSNSVPPMSSLECGRMYLIYNPKLIDLVIPNFTPSAINVDMGRISISDAPRGPGDATPTPTPIEFNEETFSPNNPTSEKTSGTYNSYKIYEGTTEFYISSNEIGNNKTAFYINYTGKGAELIGILDQNTGIFTSESNWDVNIAISNNTISNLIVKYNEPTPWIPPETPRTPTPTPIVSTPTPTPTQTNTPTETSTPTPTPTQTNTPTETSTPTPTPTKTNTPTPTPNIPSQPMWIVGLPTTWNSAETNTIHIQGISNWVTWHDPANPGEIGIHQDNNHPGDSSQFVYDANSNGGCVVTNNPLDYENPTDFNQDNSYHFTLVATQNYSGGSWVVEKSIELVVANSTSDDQFTPTTKAELQTAVNAWIANEADAISTYGDINTWNTSNITDMSYLFTVTNQSGFKVQHNFNSDISNWDTSNVTTINNMFYNAISFNQPIGSWDTSKVENMISVFREAHAFDQPIGDWNTSSVTTMGSMFRSATSFNQPIGDWDTSGVTNVSTMFESAIAFNQNISSWNTSSMGEFPFMFRGALAFNQPIGNWDVSSSTSFFQMFSGATSFDQNIGNWDISGISWSGALTDMFRSVAAGPTGLSTANYDALLNGWSTLNTVAGETRIPTGITFDGGNSQYSSAGEAARNTLINTYGWTITDGGKVVFTPADKAELQTAVNAWIANEADAISTYGDINTWNTSNITDMYALFQQKQTFNSDIGNWDVSNVTNMGRMFSGAYAFNAPIGTWDVSKVENMEYMFNFTYAFNHNLNLWDTSSVTNMKGTFDNAFAFNGNIGTWDTSNVTTMDSIFRDQNSTGAFNQDISMKSVTQNGRTYDAWDTGNVTNMNHAFYGQASFNQPIGNWDTSKVTNMTFMFGTAYAFNQPLNSWNVSSVTSVDGMFYNATTFNQPLSSWSTDNVSIFEKVFRGATNFNQPIGQWNTDSATSMEQMFEKATNFNQDIGSWNTSSVTNMSSMFKEASAFNAPINNWQTGEVTTMLMMFRDTVFDQTLSGWDTGKCTSFSHMFYNNTVFNKDISGWDTQNVTRIDYMFTGGQSSAFNRNIGSWRLDSLTNATEFLRYNSSLSTANYDLILAGWADAHTADETIPSNIDINFGNTMYSAAGQSARDTLVNTYNWTITDGGMATPPSTVTITDVEIIQVPFGSSTLNNLRITYSGYSNISKSIYVEVSNDGEWTPWENFGNVIGNFADTKDTGSGFAQVGKQIRLKMGTIYSDIYTVS